MKDLPSELRDSAWLHGASTFTTLRTRHGEPLLWDEHAARLAHTCTFLGLPDPRAELGSGPGPLEALPQGRLRITVTLGGVWRSHDALPPLDVPRSGVRVWLSDVQVHPQLAGHKTGNYLPYLLARREAQAGGCFEALLINAYGHVVDGSISGFVAELEGQKTIPAGGLPSITAACWRRESGTAWREAQLAPADLRVATRLWLTGSGIGVIPVAELTAPAWTQAFDVRWPDLRHPALKSPGT